MNFKVLEFKLDNNEKLSFSDMQVVIPAGGYASRLGRLALECPKVLIPVNKKPFVYILLNWLKNQGIKNIHFCLGHLAQKIVDELNKINSAEFNITYSIEYKPLGIAGALKNSSIFIKEKLFLIHGDILPRVDLYDLFLKFSNQNKPMIMSVVKNDLNFELGNVNVKNDLVSEYGRVPNSKKYKYLDVGVYMFKKEVLDYIPDGTFYSDKNLIEELVNRNKVEAFMAKDYSLEIGSIEGYITTKKILKNMEGGE